MKSRKEQFEYDLAKIMVSLALRQTNWACEWPLKMTNNAEPMFVWVGNGIHGIYFNVEGRTWGATPPTSLLVLNLFSPWRHKLYKRSWKTINAKCVRKYGTFWDVVGSVKEMKKDMEIISESFRACKASRISATGIKQHQFGAGLHLLYVQAKEYFSLQRFIRHRNHWTRWWFE